MHHVLLSKNELDSRKW